MTQGEWLHLAEPQFLPDERGGVPPALGALQIEGPLCPRQQGVPVRVEGGR